MKLLLIAVGGYFGLLYLKSQAQNAAFAACTPAQQVAPNGCPGYTQANANWSWLPTPTL
jgi:hypothetical protein